MSANEQDSSQLPNWMDDQIHPEDVPTEIPSEEEDPPVSLADWEPEPEEAEEEPIWTQPTAPAMPTTPAATPAQPRTPPVATVATPVAQPAPIEPAQTPPQMATSVSNTPDHSPAALPDSVPERVVQLLQVVNQEIARTVGLTTRELLSACQKTADTTASLQNSVNLSIQNLAQKAAELQEQIASATEANSTAEASKAEAIITSAQNVVAQTEEALANLNRDMERIVDTLEATNSRHERALETSEGRYQQILSHVQKASEHLTGVVKKDMRSVKMKIWAQAAAIGALTGTIVIPATTVSQPGWTLSELQRTQLSAGQMILEEYHRAEEPRKREIERLFGWKSPAQPAEEKSEKN